MDGTTAPDHCMGHTRCVRLYQDIFQVSLSKRLRSPTRPVSFSAGRHRPSWFDIRTLPPGHDEWDEAGIVSSVASVEASIQAEVNHGVDPHRIILVGFSQGAALSFLVALKTTHQLGGVISLSGWIPHKGRDVSHNRTVPSVTNAQIISCRKSHSENPAFLSFVDRKRTTLRYQCTTQRKP
jgi:predicted esterase